MPWTDAFAEHELRHKAAVMADTWGHLAPKPNIKYPAKILFTQSETGDLIVIKSEIGDLPGSPWLHEDLIDFVDKRAKEPGEVYKFAGYYIKFQNGNCRFTGKVAKICIEL